MAGRLSLSLPPDDLADLPVVYDFAEIPLDGFTDTAGGLTDTEEPDEDNSVLATYADKGFVLPPDHPSLARPRSLGPTRPPKAKILGPLRREIRVKTPRISGLDVRAIYRALSRAGVVRWVPGGLFPKTAGVYWKRSLIEFQKRHHLSPDGVYGAATHKALGPFFDAYAIKLYQEAKVAPKMTPGDLKRQTFISNALYLYHMRSLVRYTMGGSRMTIVRRHLSRLNVFAFGQIWEDCSSIGKGMFEWLNVPDPNGFGYSNPWGFTGTMTRTGRSIPVRLDALKVGDALLTGSAPYHHVWYFLGSGIGFSHGKDSDPRIVVWNYRPISRAQRYIAD